MAQGTLVIFKEELDKISDIIGRLLHLANAKCIYLIDKDGQLIATEGDTAHIDSTSLASLTAGNIAATGGLAKLIGEKEFSILFHEGEKDNIHISLIGDRVILVVIFDKRSSIGLVRLRVKRTSDELTAVIDSIVNRDTGESETKVLDEISDDDIERLFK